MPSISSKAFDHPRLLGIGNSKSCKILSSLTLCHGLHANAWAGEDANMHARTQNGILWTQVA